MGGCSGFGGRGRTGLLGPPPGGVFLFMFLLFFVFAVSILCLGLFCFVFLCFSMFWVIFDVIFGFLTFFCVDCIHFR